MNVVCKAEIRGLTHVHLTSFQWNIDVDLCCLVIEIPEDKTRMSDSVLEDAKAWPIRKGLRHGNCSRYFLSVFVCVVLKPNMVLCSIDAFASLGVLQTWNCLWS